MLFVGEKRSPRAISLGVRWEDGRLAAKVLHEALAAAGVDPSGQRFVNLYHDGDGWSVSGEVLAEIRASAASGIAVVALGRRVERELRRAGVPHRFMVHPAALGSIRRTERYQSHVATVCGQIKRRIAP